jgi:uncharacterized membrane protein YkvA (DUF1232 family)
MRLLLVSVAICIALWLLATAALIIAGRRVAARQLANLLPDLAALLRGLAGDPRVSRRSKLLLGAAAVYVVSPVDLLPEFIPLLGPLDDVIVVALVLRHVARKAGPRILADHWRGDPAILDLAIRALRLNR